jgi:integrase
VGDQVNVAARRVEPAGQPAQQPIATPRPTMTIGRMWRRARQAAFTAEVAASPLAKTPYDLRHAAVSTWLNGGVPPTTVAEWAGHSVEILLRIYAKCLDGGDALIRQRVQAALGYDDTATDVSLSHVRP